MNCKGQKYNLLSGTFSVNSNLETTMYTVKDTDKSLNVPEIIKLDMDKLRQQKVRQFFLHYQQDLKFIFHVLNYSGSRLILTPSLVMSGKGHLPSSISHPLCQFRSPKTDHLVSQFH